MGRASLIPAKAMVFITCCATTAGKTTALPVLDDKESH